METLFLYFGKVFLCSGVMFLYYKLFLKDKTFHHYNRFYLLAILVISIFLPFLKINYFTIAVNNDIYLLINKIQNFNTTKTLNDDFFYFKLIAYVVGLCALFLLTKLLVGIIKIQQLKKNFTKENFEGINFYQTDLQEAPFSFFKNLFWKNSISINSDLGRQILKHEMVHIEQKHSRDKIFIEIITCLFWFNPIFHLIKKEISLIHEYLADKKAIKNSDTKAFAQMLLASHFSGKEFQATSPFLSSNLKKRLTMLKKSQTKYSYARRILALPLLFTLAFIYLVTAKNKEIAITNFEVEKMISEIKKDTIISKDVAYGTDGTELYKKNPELFFDNDSLNEKPLADLQNQISEKQKQIEPYRKVLQAKSGEAQKISTELRKKSEELQKLSAKKDFENPKFKALEKEMDLLGSKLDGLFSTEDFKLNEKLMEKNFKDLDQLYAKLDQYYNSDEFTSNIKAAEFAANEAEKRVNSPEFKKMIKDAEKQAKKAEKLINSPKFKKQIQEAEKKAKDAEKLINSPEMQKKIKNAVEITNTGKGNSSFVFVDSGKNWDRKGEIKYFLNGNSIKEEDFKNLESSKIKSMNVYKNGSKDNKTGEIHIITK